MKIHIPRLALGAIAAVLAACRMAFGADEAITLDSPNQATRVVVALGEQLGYSVVHRGKTLVAPSPLSMVLEGDRVLGAKPRLSQKRTGRHEGTVKPLYGKNAEIAERYNELELAFEGNYSLLVRAYNEGVALRFATAIAGDITVKNEKCCFCFPADLKAYMIVGEKGRFASYEGTYDHGPISHLDPRCTATLPVTIETAHGTLLSIAESDLDDYPGMYLSRRGHHDLESVFRSYPSERDTREQRCWLRHGNNDFIAKTRGHRSFPWRILMIAESDKDLLANELVYLLAPGPAPGSDFSWVKPGTIIAAWDHAGKPGQPLTKYSPGLTGVDFESGMNYETFKYYIDFAVKHKIEYVNIDAGWSDWKDLSKINPTFDLPRVLSYARSRGQRVFLWCPANTLTKRLEEHLATFERWGVAGLKVDFFDWDGTDNQHVANDYLRIAAAAARRHLLLLYHGASVPTGICRRYPNLLAREAVLGSEWDKWSDKATPGHDVSIALVRGLAGPLDYMAGAMRNAAQKDFRPIFDIPMTQGTRCHQLAMFVVYYSPLQFMVDVPTNYAREPECLEFLASIPTTWDRTLPLGGKIAQHVCVARKKGDAWYVAAMTDWNQRQLTIRCDFLDDRTYRAEIFQDGINANFNANDWRRVVRTVRRNEQLTIPMANGGGWAAKLVPVP
jgi:alpha-glucosidase